MQSCLAGHRQDEARGWRGDIGALGLRVDGPPSSYGLPSVPGGTKDGHPQNTQLIVPRKRPREDSYKGGLHSPMLVLIRDFGGNTG